MKITKSQLKQIIKEEVQENKALLKAIDNLASKIDTLDISIDFLSAAMIGGDPMSIGAGQKSRGRAFKPFVPKSVTPAPPSEKVAVNEAEISDMICEELSKMIAELHATLDDSGISDDDQAQKRNHIDVLENILNIRGCAAPEA